MREGQNIAQSKHIETHLQKEFPYMLKFFRERGVQNPMIRYDFDAPQRRWLTLDFPLPDGKEFCTKTEKMLFLLDSYPDFPPCGFYISKKSPNRELFRQIFTLTCHATIIDNEEWCLVNLFFSNNQWDFDKEDIRKGHSFTYYLYIIYFKITNFSRPVI